MDRLHFFIHTLLEIFFPDQCLGCKKNGEGIVCESCQLKINPRVEKISNNSVALFKYEEPLIKSLLWQLKYYNNTRAGKILASYAFDYLLEEYSSSLDFNFDKDKLALIPVPLSKKKYRKRGFNQAEILAKEIAKHSPEIFEVRTDIVTKTRETKTQVSCKTRQERLTNVKEAFAIKLRAKDLAKKHIIIDDTLTTGATTEEIYRVLRKAGVKNIDILAIAHG